jgi:CubicO group peptidase (beta-lactamase class C family)
VRKSSRFATIAVCLLAIALSESTRCRAADNSAGLAAILSQDYSGLRALVVARGDCVAFEYYRPGVTSTTRSPIYSVTKSLLSILVGIAIDSGRLKLDQTLGDILPETAEDSVDPMARTITVRALLTMTSGFDAGHASVDGVRADGLWRWMIERPMRYPPGTRFAYDGVSVNILSVILARAVEEDSARFAQRSLFGPLQIDRVGWSADAEGHLIGDTGLRLTARDMAKIGLLYLRKGLWKDRRIISESYVRDSTTRHSVGGPPVGAAYGYLWWVGPIGNGHPAFFAAGQDGQLILVIPDLDLVVAVSAEGLPAGSRRFVEDAVLPIVASGPVADPCATRLE